MAGHDCAAHRQHRFPRVILGGWQLSDGHSEAAKNADRFALVAGHFAAGIRTIDMGDIYTGGRRTNTRHSGTTHTARASPAVT